MFSVRSLHLHKVIAGLTFHRYVSKPHIADESGHLLAHILVHDRTQADELPLAFTVDTDVLNRDVLQPHVLTRLQQEWRHAEVDNVEIPEGHVAHERGTTLVSEQEDAGPVAPENRVLHRNSFNVAVRRAEVEPFKGNAIVIAPNEAIGNQHILGVAWVDAIIVLDAGVAELHIPDSNSLTVPGHDGPVGRAAQRDVTHFDVGAVANRNQIAHRAFAPPPVGAVQNASPTNPNVGSFDQHLGLHDGSAGKVKGLVAVQDDFLWLVYPGAEVNNALIAGLRCICLQGIRKQQQGAFFTIRFYTELSRFIQRQVQSIVILQIWLDPERLGADNRVPKRPLGYNADHDTS